MVENLTRKELKALKNAKEQKTNSLASKLKLGGLLGGVLLMVAGLVFGISKIPKTATESKTSAADIVSKTGIHWHPELKIVIKGQAVPVPANLGIGKQYSKNKWYDPMMDMTDVHTHSDVPVLHWEVMDNMAPVTKDHVRLANIFEIWGKQFSSNCIFDSCNGPNGKVSMTVNSRVNTEFDHYLIKDKDKIEIRFE